MAGTYPDVPGKRFQLDVDGSAFFTLNDALTVTTPQPTAGPLVMNINNDGVTIGGLSNSGFYFGCVFPELRDVVGYSIYAYTQANLQTGVLQYSTNTTDGLDGTWTTLANPFVNQGSLTPNFRTITPVSLSGMKGFRARIAVAGGAYTGTFATFHLYGSITAGQNVDRLRFWHPTLDQEIDGAYFDFGDQPVGTTITKQFRVKNNSSTLTANTVTLTRDSLSFTEVQTGLTFNTGGADQTTLNIGNLAPGAISSVITLKRVILANETPVSVPKEGRITAAATTWS